MPATPWSLRGWSAGALGVVLALSLMGGPATADTTVLDDPVGDSTAVDISRVRVAHRDSVTVRVRSAVPLTVGQAYTFWIDTARGPGPIYRITFRANTEFDDRLGVVRSFGTRPSRFVPCPGLRARADIFSGRPVSLRVPRRCLDDPRRVRVAVRFTDDATRAADWSADRRTFGPWVRR